LRTLRFGSRPEDGIILLMSTRTEIELPLEQWQQLQQLAKRRERSVEQLIAEAVAYWLQQQAIEAWEARKQRALSVVGRFPAEPDLAQKHDEYLEVE